MAIKRIKQIAEGGIFTEGQLRWWVFNRKANGMDQHDVVHKVGKTVFIDEQALESWIKSSPKAIQQGAAV